MAGSFDCGAARRAVQKEFKNLVILLILSLLPLLVTNNVVTMQQKREIEQKEQTELKGMDYFLTNVIITSLQLNVTEKYKGYLLSMEQHDNSLFNMMAQRLGKCIMVILTYIHTNAILNIGGSKSVP